MTAVQRATLHVLQSLQVVVGIKLIEGRAGGGRHGVLTPDPIAVQIVAVTDPVDVGIRPRVEPAGINDSPELVQPPVDVARRAGAAGRAEQRVLRARLWIRHLDGRPQAQVRVIDEGRRSGVKQGVDEVGRISEGFVANVEYAVLDAPVCPIEIEQSRRVGLIARQVRDAVGHFSRFAEFARCPIMPGAFTSDAVHLTNAGPTEVLLYKVVERRRARQRPSFEATMTFVVGCCGLAFGTTLPLSVGGKRPRFLRRIRFRWRLTTGVGSL